MTWRDILINFLRDLLRARTRREILLKELKEAYLSKLNAETALEYAESVLQYNEARIARINKRLADLGENE
jgi:hypothetical protein